MKSSIRAPFLHVLTLAAALLAGCGDDAADGDDITKDDAAIDAGLDANAQAVRRYDATLVPIESDDAGDFIAVPHQVSLLDGDGNELVPPVATVSGPQGQISLVVPAAAVSVYVIGVGPIDDDRSTYDTVLVSYNWSAGETLLGISSRAHLDLTAETAGFKVRSDRAAMYGAIWWTKDGVRQGNVGCAKVYIDGEDAPDEDQSQRYFGDDVVAVPLAEQSQTGHYGDFHFGNMKVGLHSIRVSVDQGQTFLAEKSLFIGRTRAGAQSPTKAILYQFAIDIERSTDPTPATCFK